MEFSTDLRGLSSTDNRQNEWGLSDSNREPRDYESPALTVELRPRGVYFIAFGQPARGDFRETEPLGQSQCRL
jgi:hypothetical protein